MTPLPDSISITIGPKKTEWLSKEAHMKAMDQAREHYKTSLGDRTIQASKDGMWLGGFIGTIIGFAIGAALLFLLSLGVTP